MGDVNLAPVCGLNCGKCDFLHNSQCPGCGYVCGRPFWAAELPGGVCPLHDCCQNQRQLEHCGLCGDFPCQTFLTMRDPSLSDEEFQKSLDERKAALMRRSTLGTEKWLDEQSPA